MSFVSGIDYSSRYQSPPRVFPSGMKMLVAGDTRRTVESLRAHFLQKRCEVETAYTSEEIQKKLSENSFDMLICGFLANDDYSLRIIEIVRRQSDVRLIFLSGAKNPVLNVKALDFGADDCLTSPASLFELDARVLRLCHRGMKLAWRGAKILLGSVEIDMSRQTVKKNGERISLTKMEYRILLHFAFNRGALIPKSDLEKICSADNTTDAGRAFNTHILNLRKKFTSVLSIKTISCHGFVLLA